MIDLTVVSVCRILSNLTNHQCYLVESSTVCRCTVDFSNLSKSILCFKTFLIQIVIYLASSKSVVHEATNIVLSEVFLIFFVLAIWLSSIGFCLNQYKSLRRLETQVHYCVNRKDPLNIGTIKIVAREQDSIIYKKKYYSTTHDTHEPLKDLHYVQQYSPNNSMQTIPSMLPTLVLNQDEFKNTVSPSATDEFTLATNIPLSTHPQVTAYRLSTPCLKTGIESNQHVVKIPDAAQRTSNNIFECSAQEEKRTNSE